MELAWQSANGLQGSEEGKSPLFPLERVLSRMAGGSWVDLLPRHQFQHCNSDLDVIGKEVVYSGTKTEAGVVEKPVSSEEASVNVHKNVRLTSAGRALLVRRGSSSGSV